MSAVSKTTQGVADFEQLCTEGIRNYSANPADLSGQREAEGIKQKLIAQLEVTVRELELHSDRKIAKIYIGKTYISRKKRPGGGHSKFDPLDHHTWKKNGVSNRWFVHKQEDYGRDGLVVLGVITRETMPERCRDKVHQEDFALAMERELLHHYLLFHPDPRVVNKSFSTGQKTYEKYYAYAVYMAFRYKDDEDEASSEETDEYVIQSSPEASGSDPSTDSTQSQTIAMPVITLTAVSYMNSKQQETNPPQSMTKDTHVNVAPQPDHNHTNQYNSMSPRQKPIRLPVITNPTKKQPAKENVDQQLPSSSKHTAGQRNTAPIERKDSAPLSQTVSVNLPLESHNQLTEQANLPQTVDQACASRNTSPPSTPKRKEILEKSPRRGLREQCSPPIQRCLFHSSSSGTQDLRPSNVERLPLNLQQTKASNSQLTVKDPRLISPRHLAHSSANFCGLSPSKNELAGISDLQSTINRDTSGQSQLPVSSPNDFNQTQKETTQCSLLASASNDTSPSPQQPSLTKNTKPSRIPNNSTYSSAKSAKIFPSVKTLKTNNQLKKEAMTSANQTMVSKPSHTPQSLSRSSEKTIQSSTTSTSLPSKQTERAKLKPIQNPSHLPPTGKGPKQHSNTQGPKQHQPSVSARDTPSSFSARSANFIPDDSRSSHEASNQQIRQLSASTTTTPSQTTSKRKQPLDHTLQPTSRPATSKKRKPSFDASTCTNENIAPESSIILEKTKQHSTNNSSLQTSTSKLKRKLTPMTPLSTKAASLEQAQERPAKRQRSCSAPNILSQRTHSTPSAKMYPDGGRSTSNDKLEKKLNTKPAPLPSSSRQKVENTWKQDKMIPLTKKVDNHHHKSSPLLLDLQKKQKR